IRRTGFRHGGAALFTTAWDPGWFAASARPGARSIGLAASELRDAAGPASSSPLFRRLRARPAHDPSPQENSKPARPRPRVAAEGTVGRAFAGSITGLHHVATV